MGSAVDDKVLVQADGVALVGFNGEGDTAVVADIAYLAVLEKVARHDIVPVQAHPYDGAVMGIIAQHAVAVVDAAGGGSGSSPGAPAPWDTRTTTLRTDPRLQLRRRGFRSPAEGTGELVARRDPQLREQPVQVRSNRSG
jgi:hypothetical protein